jgi:hypothetical protein
MKRCHANRSKRDHLCFVTMASASVRQPGGAAAAAAVMGRKQINRVFTQGQELALATEIVDGEIVIEVQNKNKKEMARIDLARGLPYGAKMKFWSAVAANLNSASWTHAFPSTAPAIAATVESNWERMLAKRVSQNSMDAQKRKRREGNAKACSGGGNGPDWNSGAGDRSDEDYEESLTTSGSRAQSNAEQDSIDSLLDAYIARVASLNALHDNKENERICAGSAAPNRKALSGQPGEDQTEVENALIEGVRCYCTSLLLTIPRRYAYAEERQIRQRSVAKTTKCCSNGSTFHSAARHHYERRMDRPRRVIETRH